MFELNQIIHFVPIEHASIEKKTQEISWKIKRFYFFVEFFFKNLPETNNLYSKREKLILGVKMTRSSYITLSECTFVTYIHTFL